MPPVIDRQAKVSLPVVLEAPRGAHGQQIVERHLKMLAFVGQVVSAFTARGYEIVSLGWAEREGIVICYAPPPTADALGGVLPGITPETWREGLRDWVMALPTGA